MKTIPLTRGYIAIVDDDDYEALARFKWYATKVSHGCIYARRNVPAGFKQQSYALMHRVILAVTDPEIHVDHKHEDDWGVDNRRENIRIATPSQNAANRRRRSDNTSGFKGVSWYKKYNKWMAYAMVDGKLKNLGYFATKLEAAQAHDRATIKSFAEFAQPNLARTA